MDDLPSALLAAVAPGAAAAAQAAIDAEDVDLPEDEVDARPAAAPAAPQQTSSDAPAVSMVPASAWLNRRAIASHGALSETLLSSANKAAKPGAAPFVSPTTTIGAYASNFL
jgi:hypothetical protein